MNKGFATVYLLISILIIATAAGAYLVKQTVNFKPKATSSVTQPTIPQPSITPVPTIIDETVYTEGTRSANWKTYTNTKYGYFIKYEQEPRLKEFSCSKERPPEKGNDTFVLDERVSTFPECGVGGYSWPISIDVYTEAVELDCKSTESWATTETELIISGITAVKCNQKFIGKQKIIPGPDEIIRVTIRHNNKVFSLYLSNVKYSKTFDQILSTFKFLDQNQVDNTLKPADSQTPAAGICGGPSTNIIEEVTINMDMPLPRCVKVSSNQKLRIVNNTDKTINVNLGKHNLSINTNDNQIINAEFGSYLAPGVHFLKVPPYFGPEIWLQ